MSKKKSAPGGDEGDAATRKKAPRPPKKPTEAEVLFEKVWKHLVCNETGRIDKALVMQELADFSLLMQEAGKVYDHITGGRIGSPAAFAEEVIAAATEVDNEALKEILVDEKEKWEEERGGRDPVVERLEDVCYVRLGNPTLAFAGRHVHVTIPGGTYSAAWCSETCQLFLDDEKPLPADWIDTAKEATKSLLSGEG